MIIGASFDINDPELWLSRAMQYGDGLFETMRVHQGNIPLFKWHMARLQNSLSKLKLKSFDESNVQSALSRLNHTARQSCVMKLVVFRAQQKRSYRPWTEEIEWVISAETTIFDEKQSAARLGVATSRLSQQKTLAGLKHLSRLEHVLLADELNEKEQLDDLILLDKKNRVIETTYQNIIFVKGERLLTPKLKNCGVNGVALQWLRSQLEIKNTHIKLDELNELDVMIIGNSIRGFRAVEKVFDSDQNQSISFATSQLIHDNIDQLWLELFD